VAFSWQATGLYTCIGLTVLKPSASVGVHRRLARLLLDTPAAAFGGASLGRDGWLDPQEAAVRTMGRAMQLEPSNVRLRLELGAVQLRAARFADARRSFASALKVTTPPPLPTTFTTLTSSNLTTCLFGERLASACSRGVLSLRVLPPATLTESKQLTLFYATPFGP
jgi:hypothetical protein